MPWDSKAYPLGCRNCGRSDVTHMAKGLCSVCYRKSDIKAAAIDGSLIEFNFESKPVDDLTDEVRPGSSGVSQGPSSTTDDEKPGFIAGLLGMGKKKGEGEVIPPLKTTEKKPSSKGRRVSTADSLADVWSGLGGLASRFGFQAVGRTLAFQGSAAGEMLDDALNGTFIDRKVLQPAVKARGRFDLVAAIVGPPAIVLQIERNPASAQVLIPLLKTSLRNALPQMVPAMKKAVAREEKITEAAREMWPDLPEGVDPADAMIAAIFGNGYLEDLLSRVAQEKADPQSQEEADGVGVNFG
jgi:hypothetical protein